MPERQLVHQSERRTTQDRNLAAGLQPAASAQFVGLLAARRVCTDTSGDERIRKTSTWLLEQGTQTPSPAPDLIPAETRTENSHWDWYSERGHFNCHLHRSGQESRGHASLFRPSHPKLPVNLLDSSRIPTLQV